MIDPACGSGHFLLGAFARLLDSWEQQAPAMDPWERIARVLTGLHGVDKNPFAVSIARFRLLLAAMKAGGVKRLAEAPDFPLNIAVGDSLLHGRGGPANRANSSARKRMPTPTGPRTSATTSGPSTSWARTPTTSSSATRLTSR